jgi:hypothetical protein
MKYARYLLAIGLLAFALQARAAYSVDDIYNDVIDIWNTVTGDVKETAQDLREQITALKDKGQTARETVQDMLDFLQHRRQPLLDFVNGNPPTGTGRCGAGTPCADFRADLEDFVLDMADLKSRFPQIEKHGLGDGTIMIDIIDHLPPIALFGVYEIFQRAPGWQDIPQNLSDLYDEIGDPDAFALEPPGASATSAATSASAATVAQTARFAIGSGYGAVRKGTEEFCTTHGQGRKNPVLGNGLKAFITHAKNLAEGIAEFIPEEKTIVAGGEGTSIKIPVQPLLKGVAGFIDSLGAQLETYFSNLEECKKIETDVAACNKLIEYRTDDGNRKAYFVVAGIAVAQPSLLTPMAKSSLSKASNDYASSKYQSAYQDLCNAYAAMYAGN